MLSSVIAAARQRAVASLTTIASHSCVPDYILSVCVWLEYEKRVLVRAGYAQWQSMSRFMLYDSERSVMLGWME